MKVRQPEVTSIAQHEFEATCATDTIDGRWSEDRDDSFVDPLGSELANFPRDDLSFLLCFFSMVEGFKDHEHTTEVRADCILNKGLSRYTHRVIDTWDFAAEFFKFIHDFSASFQGCRVGQANVHKQIAFVLSWDKPGWSPGHPVISRREESDVEEHNQGSTGDESRDTASVDVGRPSEELVEPSKEPTEQRVEHFR